MLQKTLLLATLGVYTSLFVLLLGTVSAVAQKATLKIEKCSSETRKTEKVETKKKTEKTVKPSPGLQVSAPSKADADTTASLNDEDVIAVGCNHTAVVTAENGPPNQTVNFTVSQSNPANILGFKWNVGDPDLVSIQVPVQLNGSGFGVSSVFIIKGLALGQTFAISQSPGFTPDSIFITVVECNCPPISTISPPRN